MGLMALLLSVVFQFLISHARHEKTIDQVQSLLLEREKLQEKLEAIFTTIQPSANQKVSFFTEAETLHVHFDGGIDPNPLFSGLQTALLFCNQQKQFCCSQQPLVDNSPIRTEILVEQITQLTWEFWDPINVQWTSSWGQEKSHLPSLIRLILHRNKESPLHWAFILPNLKPIPLIR